MLAKIGQIWTNLCSKTVLILSPQSFVRFQMKNLAKQSCAHCSFLLSSSDSSSFLPPPPPTVELTRERQSCEGLLRFGARCRFEDAPAHDTMQLGRPRRRERKKEKISNLGSQSIGRISEHVQIRVHFWFFSDILSGRARARGVSFRNKKYGNF